MNDEQRDLARRLADAIRYGPQPRKVHVIERSSRMRCVRDRDGALIPDLTDAATGGVLLDMLGDGWLAVRARGWGVHKPGSPISPPRHHGETLAEACARALLAEWGDP